jgi:hypothetical protein
VRVLLSSRAVRRQERRASTSSLLAAFGFGDGSGRLLDLVAGRRGTLGQDLVSMLSRVAAPI